MYSQLRSKNRPQRRWKMEMLKAGLDLEKQDRIPNLVSPLGIIHVGFVIKKWCFADEEKKKWTFTFPESITAVKHSDVEIPCTFTAPDDPGEVHIIWYKYNKISYPIVYSEDSSTVILDYRGRTSLIRDGTNNCSLRITDVRYTAQYYPGISEKINAFDLNTENKKRYIRVIVSGCQETDSCQDWGFKIPYSIEVLKGSCVDVPCKLTYPDDTKNFTLFWYKNTAIGYPKIFSSRNPTDVEGKYKGRTSLVGNSLDNCTLRIDNVQEPDEVYPGINEDINSYELHNGKVTRLFIIDSPPKPVIIGPEKMRENEAVTVRCSVNHTCASSPPTITWNKPGLEVTTSQEEFIQGLWRINSIIRYIPIHKDDKSQLECKATFPNTQTMRQSITLDIQYKPQNVTISALSYIEEGEGDANIVLECRSQANPPVTKYTWYKAGKAKTLVKVDVQISVQNKTQEKYICTASNDMGTRESAVFSFTTEDEAEDGNYKNILIIGGAAGFTALVIILLVVILCIVKRKRRTSVLTEKKRSEVRAKMSEEVTMDNLLYVNLDRPPMEHSPPARNSMVGQDDKGEETNKDPEHSVIYTSVELSPANHPSPTTRNTGETEYAELNI
ncbi:sialic acid-binding Ig-like lectin 12 [Leptodactylus fuscus]|uniref:sialic acid-binding Ig-like lectin 12 n=1 Tax=Leptodactylus fuscus TaxID=238119 RepID=UPI003F4F0A00